MCELSDVCKKCYNDNCNDQPFNEDEVKPLNSGHATHISSGWFFLIILVTSSAIRF